MNLSIQFNVQNYIQLRVPTINYPNYPLCGFCACAETVTSNKPVPVVPPIQTCVVNCMVSCSMESRVMKQITVVPHILSGVRVYKGYLWHVNMLTCIYM